MSISQVRVLLAHRMNILLCFGTSQMFFSFFSPKNNQEPVQVTANDFYVTR